MTRTVDHATMRRWRCLVGLSAALTCSAAAIASAEVRVEGSPAAVRVTTSHDTIADVLQAFAATFDVKYRSAIPLDAAANATYSGSLAQVISRLLDGYSYVIKRDREATEIAVVSERGGVVVSPIAPKAPAAKGIVSRWR